MAIVYHENSQTFHLYNEEISYIFKVLKNGHLGHVYFGKKVNDRDDFSRVDIYLPRTIALYQDDRAFSLEHIRQEYPVFGSGDMRHPAFVISQEDGSELADFVYTGYHLYEGKADLHPLPHVYGDEFTSLDVYLYDEKIQVEMVLRYSIADHLPVITRSVRFENKGPQSVALKKVMSFSLDLPDCDYEMVYLTGAWARERHIHTRALDHGATSIESLRGHSSANFNPFFALKRPYTGEDQGEVYGFTFLYSGNFIGDVQVDTYDTTRVMMGINPQQFSWQLQDSFQSPEALLVYSDQGMAKMSQTFHEILREHVARGYWRDKERPVLINNWEGTFFDFNEEKILAMARIAKELGIELFVLDDGWFGRRDNDFAGLGDWVPNREKLPSGIAGLADKIHAMGLMFGLWFEPEMVNEDSDLFSSHPEWRLETPGRKVSAGRHQYVLDMANPEVVDYLYEMMSPILSHLDYVKWDMNRSLSEVYSRAYPKEKQGEIYHRHILGVYDLYDRLTKAFPKILFESCASGGGRFDGGMLYYAPQAWVSDNTDAVERLKIQYGSSLVYPLSSFGAHVSASPNHQLHHETPLSTRANVAYFGTFGYELDLTKLEEKEEVKAQIAFMKKYRRLFQFGRFYRLRSPFEHNDAAWMVCDENTAIVGYYRIMATINDSYHRVKLRGLDPNANYRYGDTVYGGDELMYIGLNVSDGTSGEGEPAGDYASRLYVFEKIQ